MEKPKYEPRLLRLAQCRFLSNCCSFLSHEGSGLECFFVGNVLSICLLLQNGNRIQHTFTDCPFEEKRWYFVALVHSKARLAQVVTCCSKQILISLLKKSELRLYIDGKQ